MKAERHFRTALEGERFDLYLVKVDAWNELIGLVEITGEAKTAGQGDAGVVELDKAWYKYSRGNNPYADYQSFKAGYNLQK